MKELFSGDIYAGLTGFELDVESIDLGNGVTLTETYSHIMTPFMMAFEPARKGMHHPGPWKSVSGGLAFDVTMQLKIPASLWSKPEDGIEIAKIIVFLMRIWMNPATTLVVISNHPFSELRAIPKDKEELILFEVERRHIPLEVEEKTIASDECVWVREHWETAKELSANNTEFKLAIDAMNLGQFVPNSTLALVSLWGALEALFSPSTTELRFRVSSLIAAYLESPGEKRLSRQKEILKLYDARSKAAHGDPSHQPDELLMTFELLREVLMKMIDERNVPKKGELELMLFGGTA